MILHEFPDLDWLKRQAEQRFANRIAWKGISLPEQGWPNVILQVDTRRQTVYRDNIPGPLSVFTNLAGESHVEVDNRRVTVKEGFFFLSNPAQRYTLEVSKSQPTQTFNIHFGDYLADQVLQAWTQRTEYLLSENFQTPPEPWSWHNTLLPRTAAMESIIHALRQSPPLPALALEENLHNLVVCLLQQETHFRKITQQLPPLRRTTREEIFRRMLRATDYIHTHFDRDLSLNELALEACLSKFHFLRLFKAAFGKTPYQFINEVRVARSKALLKTNGLTVRDVARAVGFDHPGSFSRMFYQHTGVYPTQFAGQ